MDVLNSPVILRTPSMAVLYSAMIEPTSSMAVLDSAVILLGTIDDCI